MTKSEQLFKRAKKVMPGGVNSPVRAFNAVGGSPRFIKSANGARVTDADGTEYLDYIGSWGPMILGHNNELVLDAVARAIRNGLSFGAATELEVEMAELVCSVVPNLEMVRMVSSGTEAVMSAIRVARGFTAKEKIIKFAGNYHGHSDSMLVKAGSGVLTNGNPDSAGVTKGAAQDTLMAQYNNLTSVEELFEQNKNQIAAIIVEPVAANMGVVAPCDGFLQGLRKLCNQNNSLLIFDEVITGFRLAIGGAQQFFGVNADLVTFGKIIGGGMPVGAYGGKTDIMSCVSPLGAVYQAGTLSGNPVAMAAGLAAVGQLCKNPEIYTNINAKAKMLAEGMQKINKRTVNNVGSLVCAFFTDAAITDYETAKNSDASEYARYFKHMLDQKIYIAPAQFEAMFISNAHTDEDLAITLTAYRDFL